MPYTLTELQQLNYDVIMLIYYGTVAIATLSKILFENFAQLESKYKGCI